MTSDKSSIAGADLATMIAEKVRVQPLVANKTQAARLLKRIHGPNIRIYINGGKVALENIPTGHVVVIQGTGPRGTILGHGKDYDAAVQDVMKEKK